MSKQSHTQKTTNKIQQKEQEHGTKQFLDTGKHTVQLATRRTRAAAAAATVSVVAEAAVPVYDTLLHHTASFFDQDVVAFHPPLKKCCHLYRLLET